MKSLFLNLIKILTNEERRKYYILLVFSLIFALVEVVGVASIMPLISMSMDIDLLETNSKYRKIYEFTALESKLHFLLFFGLVVLLYFIFRAIFSVIYIKYISRYVYKTYNRIIFTLFEKYLNLSLGDFSRLNSSTITKVLITEAYNLAGVLQVSLTICAEIIILIFIYSILIFVDLRITLGLTFTLVIISIILNLTVSKKIKMNGIKRVSLHRNMYESINKSLHNYKIIKLIPGDSFLNDFEYSCDKFKNILISNTVLQATPRIVLECISFSILILLVLYIYYTSYPDTKSAMSVVSVFVLGLYRMMPSINKIMSGYNQLLYNLKSIDVITTELALDSEKLGHEKIKFDSEIVLTNLSFSHGVNSILTGINVVIKV